MPYLGELISIGVAFSWTATALLSEYGSKRLGNLQLNVMRMLLALLFSMVLFWVVTGCPLPTAIPASACAWMLLSGVVGYVVGDFCLFQCYIIIGSRYGQLFMTLAPLAAALAAWGMLGQQMPPMSVVAMVVTLCGIGITVMGRGSHHALSLKLPLAGVLYAVGAALCQGVGLVLSKVFSGWLAMRISGFTSGYGVAAGLMTVPQLSATLAAAAIGREQGVLDGTFFNAIIILSVVTTLPVPTLVRVAIRRFGLTFHVAPYRIPAVVKDEELL